MSDDTARLLGALERVRSMRTFAEGEGGFFELMDILEAEWLDQWRKTEPGDVTAREAIHARCAALSALRHVMHAAIASGKPAEAELKRLRRVDAGTEKAFH